MKTCGYVWATESQEFPEDATVFATRERARDAGLGVYEGTVYTGIMLRVEPADLVSDWDCVEGLFVEDLEFHEGLANEVTHMLYRKQAELQRAVRGLLIGMLTEPCAELKSYEVREIEKHEQSKAIAALEGTDEGECNELL